MRKRIINYMCILSAAAVVVVAAALLLLERRWIDEHGVHAILEPEYIFYVILIIVLALAAVLGLSLMLSNRIIHPLENSLMTMLSFPILKSSWMSRTASLSAQAANWRKCSAISALWWQI